MPAHVESLILSCHLYPSPQYRHLYTGARAKVKATARHDQIQKILAIFQKALPAYCKSTPPQLTKNNSNINLLTAARPKSIYFSDIHIRAYTCISGINKSSNLLVQFYVLRFGDFLNGATVT